jgi:hypothetical protein
MCVKDVTGSNVGAGPGGAAAAGKGSDNMASVTSTTTSAAMIAALMDPALAGFMPAAAAGNLELLRQLPGIAEVLNRVNGNLTTRQAGAAAAGASYGSGGIASQGNGGSDDTGGTDQQRQTLART